MTRQVPRFGDEELAFWHDSLKLVVSSLREKQANPQSPKKIGLFFCGGGMRAAYGAGQTLALYEVGYTPDVFECVLGASAGAVVATAYVDSKASVELGVKAFSFDLSTPRFISFHPRRWWRGNVIDLQMVVAAFQFLPQVLKSATTPLYYVYSEPATGVTEPAIRIMSVTDAPSPIDGIIASMSIPRMTGSIPKIQGEILYDGSFTNLLPIDVILEHFPDLTDLLVVPQLPWRPLASIRSSLLARVTARCIQMTPLRFIPLLQQLRQSCLVQEKFRTSLKRSMSESRVRIGILWPPDCGMTATTVRTDKATYTITRSYAAAKVQLREVGIVSR